MANKLKLEITTPEKVIFSEEVNEVVIPTPLGEIGVLPHHIPLVSLLCPGEMRIKKDKETVYLAVSGGFIEVRPDKVVILADTAEREEEIDEKRAKEAKERAEKLMKEKRLDATEFAAVSARIEKEFARLKVVKRRRHERRQGI